MKIADLVGKTRGGYGVMCDRPVMKIKRGMMYWFNPFPNEKDKNVHEVEANGKIYKSCVLAGHRPWIVVSCNESNGVFSTCNICPVTTSDKGDIPIHAYFDYKGKKETVLTEQILTVDTFQLTEFEGMVSKEVMDDIDRALAIQLGIKPMVRYVDSNFENAIKQMEKIVEEAIRTRVERLHKEPVSEEILVGAASRLGSLFEELINKKTAEPAKTVPASPRLSLVRDKVQSVISDDSWLGCPIGPEVEYLEYSKTDAEITKSIAELSTQVAPSQSVETGRKRRFKWTEELSREFLMDTKNLSIEEVMEKYDMTKLKQVSQRKYICKQALGL